MAEPRYLKMLEELGPKLHRQLVCGLHVHVGMESFDACLQTLAAIVPWLPTVLALSLNSPYMQGGETGALSSRAARLAELPRGGEEPPSFASPEEWEAYIEATGKDYTRSWWDARPHPRLGTLEVRIADQPTSVERSAALAALVQALCAEPPTEQPTGEYSEDRAAAARGSAPTERLLTLVEPAARELGTSELVDTLREPAEALRQLEVGAPRRPHRRGSRSRRAHRRMNGLRSALYPLRLVAARLGRRSAPVVLVVLGIAAGASVVFGGRAGTLVAQDRAVAQAVERIPEGQRSVRAVWFGIPAQSDEPQPALDRRARAALARRGRRAPDIARPLPRDHDCGRVRRSRRRRAPRRLGDAALGPAAVSPCSPERCEVLRLRGEGRLPHAGRAADPSRWARRCSNDSVLFGDFLAPTDNALADAEVSPSLARAAGYHRPPPPPLFLADGGVDVLAELPALDTIFRSYAWVVAARAGQAAPLGGRRARGRRRPGALGAPVGDVELRPPRAGRGAARGAGDEPRGGPPARDRRRRGGGAPVRVRAPGGDDAAHRPCGRPQAPRLVRRAWLAARARHGGGVGCARAWQAPRSGSRWARSAGALVAERAGAPVGDVLARSVLSGEGLGLALLVAAAATGVLVGAVAARAARPGFGLVDAAAVAAIALVALELARGDGDGDLTLLLPALVTFAAAVARRAPAAAGAARRRAARPAALARPAARVALARAQPRLRGGRDRVPRRQLRPGALRRELPRHARARRARPGGASRPARLRRPRGPAAADPRAGRCVLRAIRRDPRRRGLAGAAADRRRWPARGREWDHAARCPAWGAGAAQRLARLGRGCVALGARAADRSPVARSPG